MDFSILNNKSQLRACDVSIEKTMAFEIRKTNCLRPPKSRLGLMKKSISYQGAVLWNSLSNDDRASNSLIILKNRIGSQRMNVNCKYYKYRFVTSAKVTKLVIDREAVDPEVNNQLSYRG